MDNIGVFCIIIPILVLVMWWAISSNAHATRMNEMKTTHGAYHAALAKLKASPHDPNLKQQALAAGRAYAHLTRERKGVTIFDEMALMNDINAATAAASAPIATPSAPMQAVLAAATVAERLRKLDDLKAQGLLSEAEYTQQRTKILSEL